PFLLRHARRHTRRIRDAIRLRRASHQQDRDRQQSRRWRRERTLSEPFIRSCGHLRNEGPLSRDVRKRSIVQQTTGLLDDLLISSYIAKTMQYSVDPAGAI